MGWWLGSEEDVTSGQLRTLRILGSRARVSMLSESQISPDWIAWSEQTGLLAADAGHHYRDRRQVWPR